MSLRPAAAAALTAVVPLILLTGCGADTDAASRASAECGSELHDQLGLSEDDTGLRTRTEVRGDDERRIVEGTWTHGEAGEGVFSCTVVPDASDELRGLRVTTLAVRYG